MGGVHSQKKSLVRGGHAKKLASWGVMQFPTDTPPNPTSPPYPLKNERSLRNTGPVQKVKLLRPRFINTTFLADDSDEETSIMVQKCNIVQGPFVIRKDVFQRIEGLLDGFGKVTLLEFFLRSKGRYVFSWGGEGWGILVFFPKKVLAFPCVLIKKLLNPPPLGD